MKLSPNRHCLSTVRPKGCDNCIPCTVWASAVRATLEDVARDLEDPARVLDDGYGGEPYVYNGCEQWALQKAAARYRQAAKGVG